MPPFEQGAASHAAPEIDAPPAAPHADQADTMQGAPSTGPSFVVFEGEDGQTFEVPSQARVRFRHNHRDMVVPVGEFLGYGRQGFDYETRRREVDELQKTWKQRVGDLDDETVSSARELRDFFKKEPLAFRVLNAMYTGEVTPREAFDILSGKASPVGAVPTQAQPDEPSPSWLSGEADAHRSTPDDGNGSTGDPRLAASLDKLVQLVGGLASRMERLEGASSASAQAAEEQRRNAAAQERNKAIMRLSDSMTYLRATYPDQRERLSEILAHMKEIGSADPVQAVGSLEAKLERIARGLGVRNAPGRSAVPDPFEEEEPTAPARRFAEPQPRPARALGATEEAPRPKPLAFGPNALRSGEIRRASEEFLRRAMNKRQS